jgi:hypothetical protein
LTLKIGQRSNDYRMTSAAMGLLYHPELIFATQPVIALLVLSLTHWVDQLLYIIFSPLLPAPSRTHSSTAPHIRIEKGTSNSLKACCVPGGHPARKTRKINAPRMAARNFTYDDSSSMLQFRGSGWDRGDHPFDGEVCKEQVRYHETPRS